ncbi:ubiquitin-conjugating enzyme family protein [Streptomyces cinereoruber]|uniref:ubiquitin-conjugating enzyme family protein n=1 Tax=Streptomyces cinereoruber TaxID=67260 RepID=UPI003C3078BF
MVRIGLVSLVRAEVVVVAGSAEQRLRRELVDMEEMTRTQVGVGDVALVGESAFHWTVDLLPQMPSAHTSRRLVVGFDFSDRYPYAPPRVRFAVPPFHPNVSGTGMVDSSVLTSEWSPTMTTAKVIVHLLDLLESPETTDPVRPEAADLYLSDRDAYQQKARASTESCAI